MCGAEIGRMDREPDFFGVKPLLGSRVMAGKRCDLWSILMALRPFISQLSIVTAYIAFAFVGAIVLGVF